MRAVVATAAADGSGSNRADRDICILSVFRTYWHYIEPRRIGQKYQGARVKGFVTGK